MHTIADQSTMPIWPVWVWALGVAILIAGWVLTIGLCRAAARQMPDPDEYEMSPYGPVNRFRSDLCMVATCSGVKTVDLGSGWVVCDHHARTLISGEDVA